MYYPYFRGKQYELITIRDNAPLMADAEFVPIIEPVKNTLGILRKSLDAVVEAGGKTIVIVNPSLGDFSQDGQQLSTMLAEHFKGHDGVSAGILIEERLSVQQVVSLCRKHEDHPVALIHSGFTDAPGLAAEENVVSGCDHIFLQKYCGKLYRKHFSPDATRVLIKDGFERRKNREYPEVQFFSDLHATYLDEGVSGFGDFLIVGDEFSETGGPAYAVAIHVTYIDSANDDAMYVYHFVSDRQDTPTDPAGKFLEALTKLVQKLDKADSPIMESKAMQEFRELHARQHFPGLGYVKKLSMQHHLETLADYFAKE